MSLSFPSFAGIFKRCSSEEEEFELECFGVFLRTKTERFWKAAKVIDNSTSYFICNNPPLHLQQSSQNQTSEPCMHIQ